MSTQLLLIGAQGHCWYAWRRSHWQALPAGLAAADVLPVMLDASILILLDLPAEECVSVAMPALKPADRKAWLRARLQQHFPGWFCAQASSEPASQVVLHGLAATEHTAALARVLAQNQAARIQGICFQSSVLAAAAGADVIAALIIAPGLCGGLRHVLTLNGRVLFTRLCQDQHQPEEDLLTTCRHLDEAGLLPASLRLCFDPQSGLEQSTACARLTQYWPDLQLVVNPHFVGAHPAQLSRRALLRHRTWLNGPLLLRQTRQRLYQFGHWGAWGLSAVAIVYSALLLYLSWQVPTDIGRAPQGSAQAARFATFDQAAMQLLDGRGKSVARMVADLQRISMALVPLEPARVTALIWQSGGTDEIRLTILPGQAQDETAALETVRSAFPGTELERVPAASNTSGENWQWLMQLEVQP